MAPRPASGPLTPVIVSGVAGGDGFVGLRAPNGEAGVGDEASGKDFFISSANESRGWAEWIAVPLERAGCSTVYQAAGFRPGRDFAHETQVAAATARRTIAVLSPAYLVSEFGEAEWRAAFVQDPAGLGPDHPRTHGIRHDLAVATSMRERRHRGGQ